MNTLNPPRDLISLMLHRARKWALLHPGEEYRRTVIYEDGNFSLVSRWMYEETCFESQYRGEIFAIKEKGKAVYSSFEPN